jgi:hypothetical protein
MFRATRLAGRAAWMGLLPGSLLLLGSLLATQAAVRADDPVDLGTVREEHVMIPMRDGKRLSAYLYRPSGQGPWPAVFQQRMASLRGKATRQAAARLAEGGLVVAMVNFRGAGLSEGTWVGYRALGWGKQQDGYDACEWLARQSWCTGKVGTFGSSQGGYAQNFLAVAAPPSLVCQYMADTGLSLFQEGYRLGGTTRMERFKGIDQVCRDPAENRALLAQWLLHPNYDDYWRAEDCSLHFDRMNVPCFTLGSWYDFMNQGSIASFIGRQHHGGPHSRGQQHLLIGPWLHGGAEKSNRVGELVYPAEAAWPGTDHMTRWFNHYLKGEANGVDREPAVRYYVMGALGEPGAGGNVWRTADDWPPPSTPGAYYLHGEGHLSTEPPSEENSSTSYTSDSRQPMQIPGRAFPGARDARSFERQRDVRTFTTEPLAELVEWTGRIRAELVIASTALDTDFLVRVSDVYPDGRSILLVDYPWRARYRGGFQSQALLKPGRPTPLAFDVGWISQVFNRGHRIRVTIASSGAPLYGTNPQTGLPTTLDFPPEALAATNTIHHSRHAASRIVAPLALGRGSQQRSSSGRE